MSVPECKTDTDWPELTEKEDYGVAGRTSVHTEGGGLTRCLLVTLSLHGAPSPSESVGGWHPTRHCVSSILHPQLFRIPEAQVVRRGVSRKHPDSAEGKQVCCVSAVSVLSHRYGVSRAYSELPE